MINQDFIMNLTSRPRLYEKGSAVMWTDPYISERLLEMHLDPEQDLASRSRHRIDHTAEWILAQSNKEKMRILDLGCGPGLYAEYFALRGHEVTGVDFSGNSIRYATGQAKDRKLDIVYLHKNYLQLDFAGCFDLVILIYLDFCVLLPEERDQVLMNIYRALKPGGMFIFDVVNDKNPDEKAPSNSWEAKEKGFWKATPYLALNDGFIYPEAKVTATRHTILDHEGRAETYIFWTHYYNREDLSGLLLSKGFINIKDYENVLPDSVDSWNGRHVTFYVAKKENM
jgi:SAM-dependent methyltransferase